MVSPTILNWTYTSKREPIKQRKKVRYNVNVYKAEFVLIFIYCTLQTVNKQINDKERIAAAMENPNLRELVENCIKDEE